MFLELQKWKKNLFELSRIGLLDTPMIVAQNLKTGPLNGTVEMQNSSPFLQLLNKVVLLLLDAKIEADPRELWQGWQMLSYHRPTIPHKEYQETIFWVTKKVPEM